MEEAFPELAAQREKEEELRKQAASSSDVMGTDQEMKRVQVSA